MKKLFYTLAILGSLFAMSCNDNSEEVFEETKQDATVEISNTDSNRFLEFEDR